MSLIILSFDQSVKRTGYAVYEPPHVGKMLVGSFSCNDGDTLEEKCRFFCTEVELLFLKWQPAAVFWERAFLHIQQHKPKQKDDLGGRVPTPSFNVSPDQLILHDLQGHIRHAAWARRKPHESVDPKTWRARVLKNGNLKRDEAKKAAMDHCAMLRIRVDNADEAEAACIALYGESSDTFRALRAKAAARGNKP